MKRKPKTSHRESTATARKAPGQWVYVTTYPARYSAQGVAYAITGGRMPYYYPPEEWGVKITDVDLGTALYIRYVGSE